MTKTAQSTGGPRPAMSYQEAYDAGLPVAVPTTGRLPVRHGVLHHAPAPVRLVVSLLGALVLLGSACLVLLLVVLVLLRVLGVPA